jgi:hypothetical protein
MEDLVPPHQACGAVSLSQASNINTDPMDFPEFNVPNVQYQPNYRSYIVRTFRFC